MNILNSTTIETTVSDYFEMVASEMNSMGFTLTLNKMFILDNTSCMAMLLCVPTDLDTRGTVALITLDIRVTDKETVTITGSSFDFAGPGIRKMKGLASRTNRVRERLEEALGAAATSDLYNEGYAPALLAEVLAETMREAGYNA